eukprot:scaffold291092_cov22-Tisochrysis_lutea.AAC.1
MTLRDSLQADLQGTVSDQATQEHGLGLETQVPRSYPQIPIGGSEQCGRLKTIHADNTRRRLKTIHRAGEDSTEGAMCRHTSCMEL